LVGPDKIVQTAKRLGVTSRLHPYFAIGLGAEPVNPLEMARAYSAFDNGGTRVDGSLFGNTPRAVTTVEGGCNKGDSTNRPVARHVLSSTDAAYVTQLLQGVVTSGTGKAAALTDRPVAGKTGTTENY